jgi:3-hydroxyacyl-CoA dehydrogenase / enoyl-CoA hydratase / 3-hydroxybutyryl-CoA epimerase
MVNYRIEKNVAILSWNVANQPMNVLNDESTLAFEAALQKAYADTKAKGIIITSERPEFVAGADLKMILKANSQGPQAMLDIITRLQGIMRSIELSGKPAVACINGTALGGGYEIALSCHYRLAINNPKTQIGLPEVMVGLLPGSGGTQRLPRMIGMEAAAPLLMEGKKVSPNEALGLGLINELADNQEQMMEKAFAWIAANPAPLQPWDEIKKGKIVARENFRVPKGNVQSPQGMQLFMAGTALMMDKSKGNYPAPLEIMSCVYEGLQVNLDRGLLVEARHFAKVAMSSVAKNLIKTMFFGLNEVNKGSSRPKDQPATDVKKLGILGAGMMGAGIAYVSSMAGIEVVLKDTSLANAEKGKDYSRTLLQKALDRGKMDAAKMEGILAKIKPTESYADIDGADLIIEAVFENRELKATVTKDAEPHLNATGVFGSNTSTLPISGLAEASINPEKFIGIHFFSPVDKMQLVELIMGKQTSDYALALALDYVKKIRKTPIVVNDSRGFYTSRVFSTYTDEGIRLMKDGVNPMIIENVAKNIGMPVGPLAVADEVALDLAYKIAGAAVKDGVLAEDDTTYQVAKQFTEMGRLGKKAKAGFYEYPEAPGKKFLWPELANMFPVAAEQPSNDDIKNRLLYRQVLETVKCWEEGVLRTKLDGDLGSIFAWGFPPYMGGTLSFVDTVGIKAFVAEADRLAGIYGERFKPTAKLREMAAAGKGFDS